MREQESWVFLSKNVKYIEKISLKNESTISMLIDLKWNTWNPFHQPVRLEDEQVPPKGATLTGMNLSIGFGWSSWFSEQNKHKPLSMWNTYEKECEINLVDLIQK